MMPFKGSGFALFIFLSVLALGVYCVPTWEDFLTRHYNYPKTNYGKKYCNKMMSIRKLDKPQCKDVNTFIHNTKNNIMAVCTKDGGSDYGNGMRISLRPFSVTTCKHHSGASHPRCTYTQHQSSRYIVVVCNAEGKPVHFDESIIVTE